jgi:hypothetical protein
MEIKQENGPEEQSTAEKPGCPVGDEGVEVFYKLDRNRLRIYPLDHKRDQDIAFKCKKNGFRYPIKDKRT